MNRIALKGGLLIDGTGAPPVKDSLILIEGRTLAYAGGPMEIPGGYEIMDISAKQSCPGL